MNKNIFSTKLKSVPVTNTVNKAGGKAYALSDQAALAQYVVTSTFGDTFYAKADEQVDKVLQLALNAEPEFLGKAAVYAHEVAGMKDTPALLLAVLAARSAIKPGITATEDQLVSGRVLVQAFPRVVTRFKMLQNFVQIIRSGKVGRRSFGSLVKKLIRNWFATRTGNALFTGSIGADPSFADVLKMVHPRAEDSQKNALYAYMIGRDYDADLLPDKVKQFEAFKKDNSSPIPDVPFQMLSSLTLTEAQWKEIILNMPWNALRMNLNTAERHGVFKDRAATEAIARKLADPEQVRKNNVFPYQLLAAYQNANTTIPQIVRNALQDAMEVAIDLVPNFGVPIAVCLDTSGSMHSPITGHRVGATTKMQYVDIAALVGASLARKNNECTVLPFDTRVHDASTINGRDSVMTNAERLKRFGGGGTDCASALRVINGMVGQRPEIIIYVSDNASWFNGKAYMSHYGGTGMAAEWDAYKRRNPKAKLILIDIDANDNTQVVDQPGVLNIGGFSDKVWTGIKNFVEKGAGDFVGVVNSVDLTVTPQTHRFPLDQGPVA